MGRERPGGMKDSGKALFSVCVVVGCFALALSDPPPSRTDSGAKSFRSLDATVGRTDVLAHQSDANDVTLAAHREDERLAGDDDFGSVLATASHGMATVVIELTENSHATPTLIHRIRRDVGRVTSLMPEHVDLASKKMVIRLESSGAQILARLINAKQLPQLGGVTGFGKVSVTHEKVVVPAHESSVKHEAGDVDSSTSAILLACLLVTLLLFVIVILYLATQNRDVGYA